MKPLLQHKEKSYLLLGEEAVDLFMGSSSVSDTVKEAGDRGVDMQIVCIDPEADSLASALEKIDGFFGYAFITKEEYDKFEEELEKT